MKIFHDLMRYLSKLELQNNAIPILTDSSRMTSWKQNSTTVLRACGQSAVCTQANNYRNRTGWNISSLNVTFRDNYSPNEGSELFLAHSNSMYKASANKFGRRMLSI